ncbi:hypothetical protein B7463_g9129, partial [Scytalidium lignicola]
MSCKIILLLFHPPRYSATSDGSDSVTYRAAAYYVNWAIYERQFNLQDLPADKLTHVFYAFANVKPDTEEVNLNRSKFASSAVSLVANFGLDALDIDWENLVFDTDAANIVLLFQAVREALDDYGSSLSLQYNFTLTVTSPAGPSNYQTMHLADMDQYIEFWNIMAYDYTGSWSAVTANQGNLFASSMDPASTPFDTQTVVTR